MEPLPPIKTSFVPRPLVGDSSTRRPPYDAGILMAVAVVALLGSLGVWGWQWWYSRTLDGTIAEKNAALVEAQTKFNEGEISSVVNDLILLSDKMRYVKNLVNQHTNLIPLFALLSDLTLRDSVRYKSFTYESGAGGSQGAGGIVPHTIRLTGEAKSFASLAYQDDVLRKEKESGRNIASHSISGMRVDEKTGRVSFILTITLTAPAVNYSATVPAF